MILADTLSRAYITDCPTSQSTFEEELACMVHMVLSNTPFTDAKLEEVRKATSEDTTKRLLQTTIQTGWPDKISETRAEFKAFWTYRDELSKADGILIKGEKILIPQSLRSDMLNRIHSTHLGVIKCKKELKMYFFGLVWEGK